MRACLPIGLAALVLGLGTARPSPCNADPGGPAPESFTPRTRVSLRAARWCINDELTNRGTRAEGLLMNVRMVNAVFEDRRKPDLDPEAITDRFLAHLPDYAAHGVNAFTLCLQGGMPGYEGALNSAFEPDGSLRRVVPGPRARASSRRATGRGWWSSSAASTSGRTRCWPTRPPCAPRWSTWRSGSRAAASATSCSRSPTSSTTTASTTA